MQHWARVQSGAQGMIQARSAPVSPAAASAGMLAGASGPLSVRETALPESTGPLPPDPVLPPVLPTEPPVALPPVPAREPPVPGEPPVVSPPAPLVSSIPLGLELLGRALLQPVARARRTTRETGGRERI